MKRFWLVLLSLGLVMAFSVSAFAVDVKVSGEYYAAGLYLNKITVDDGFAARTGRLGSLDNSTAFFFQRLRVGTDFVVSPSLKLVTRFDAMERIWGGARSNTWQANAVEPNYSAGTRAETENIAFDLMYIDYTSPIGKFLVGYMPDYVWGTAFGDRANGGGVGQIQYFMQSGPFIGLVAYAKEADNSYSAVSSQSWYYINNINATRTDRDNDSYRIAGIYNFKNDKAAGEAGVLILWNRSADHKGWASTDTAPFYAPIPYLQNIVVIDPYVKAKVGPVALQAEFQYWFGDAAKWENNVPGAPSNVSLSAMSLFLDATATFGPVYVGGSFAYLSGDDPNTPDKIEGSVNTAGLDWNPCLIMFNTETAGYWVGPLAGHSGSVVDAEMSNAYFFQGRVGVKPTPQLDAMLSVSYATADKKPAGFQNGSYGWEIDVTGTYKITNNLSYMLGVGYLFTGDYFKGYNDFPNWGDAKVQDDYILINKLVLSF